MSITPHEPLQSLGKLDDVFRFRLLPGDLQCSPCTKAGGCEKTEQLRGRLHDRVRRIEIDLDLRVDLSLPEVGWTDIFVACGVDRKYGVGLF